MPGRPGIFSKNRKLSNYTICTSSKNSSTKKPKQVLESLDLSKQTFDTLKKFKELFRGNSVKISNFWDRGGGQLISFFWLPGIETNLEIKGFTF